MAGAEELRVWVLSDGQPGHFNQSRGILAALRRIRPLQESWIALDLRIGLGRNLLRYHLNRKVHPGPARRLRAFYRMGELPHGGCDLVVSAGGKTSFANAWLARRLGVPNLYAGSLRRLSAELFSVVLTLEPVPGAASNLVLPLPASAIDADEVRHRGERFHSRLGDPAQRYWLLLAGGDGAGYRYLKHDWIRLANLMNSLARGHGIRWLVVSSRRTGSTGERLLQRHLEAPHLAAGCWARQRAEYQAEDWLGAAERVFVTEDSMTMLTEAVYARRPLHSLQPQHCAPDQRYRASMQRFADQGFICRHRIADLLLHPHQLEECHCRPMSVSPLDQLAEALRQRLSLEGANR
ncbi:MAG TPA: hypothetical protein ENK05_09080 [Gammaproteobacteria bacterium]|nr:hypothetical protein [Gammaproteobacteria bacterium]